MEGCVWVWPGGCGPVMCEVCEGVEAISYT